MSHAALEVSDFRFAPKPLLLTVALGDLGTVEVLLGPGQAGPGTNGSRTSCELESHN